MKAKMKEEEKRKISKFLSLILRHNPGLVGISPDEQGWNCFLSGR